MSTTTLFIADELLAFPTGMGKRYELVLGQRRETAFIRKAHVPTDLPEQAFWPGAPIVSGFSCPVAELFR